MQDENPENLTDPSLLQLREHTKNTMIPLLIRAFQLRMEAQQLNSPPSRLQPSKPKGSLADVVRQLTQLDEDLQLQQIWIQSCQSQIQKIRKEIEEQQPLSPLKSHVDTNPAAHPAIQESFQKALSPSRSWWQKFLRLS
jgi:hypothetical protein